MNRSILLVKQYIRDPYATLASDVKTSFQNVNILGGRVREFSPDSVKIFASLAQGNRKELTMF